MAPELDTVRIGVAPQVAPHQTGESAVGQEPLVAVTHGGIGKVQFAAVQLKRGGAGLKLGATVVGFNE